MSTEAGNLRELLSVVVEALSVPGGDPYNRRIADRAMWVEVTVRGALADPVDDLPFSIGFLRRKLQAEEASQR